MLLKSGVPSAAMMRIAAQDGTTDIVATPHANYEYPFDPQSIDRCIRELGEASDHVVPIHRGCDFHLSASNILDALDHPSKYHQPGTIPPGRVSRLGHPSQHRVRLLAIPRTRYHPGRDSSRAEHDVYRHMPRLQAWVEASSRVQVTAQALLCSFGKPAQRYVIDLMDRRLVHFVASDAHDLTYRKPVLSEAFRWLEAGYRRETAGPTPAHEPRRRSLWD